MRFVISCAALSLAEGATVVADEAGEFEGSCFLSHEESTVRVSKHNRLAAIVFKYRNMLCDFMLFFHFRLAYRPKVEAGKAGDAWRINSLTRPFS